MQIGAIYPQIELGGDPQALEDLALAVEAQGYDYLTMFDHVLGADREGRDKPLMGPYSDKDPFHDPLVAFGFLASATRTLGLASGVLILPQRQTALVARQAADVDLLSRGRLRLGVGIGWNPVEYEALGQDFTTRGARIDEQIPLLRRLWSGDAIAFDGRFDRIDRAALNPRPKRQIPIWCGGGSEAAYRRAARLADGFIFSGPYETMVLPGWAQIRTMLAEQGRSPAEFGGEYLVSQASNVSEAVEHIGRWRDAGGTHAGVRTMGLGFTDVRQHIDYLADVKAALN